MILGSNSFRNYFESLSRPDDARFISSRECTEMFGNISLLTGFCVVWFFFAKGRSDVFFTTITRDKSDDTFTNRFCENCSKYGAVKDSGGCSCESKGSVLGSVFVRSEGTCKSGTELRGKWNSILVIQ